MDILEKINKLRLERGWSVYKLAEESGLTQSTIANMFSRKTMPSISTLTQICNAFGISLSEFFSDNKNELNDEEFLLLANFRKLSEKDKNTIKSLISSLINYK